MIIFNYMEAIIIFFILLMIAAVVAIARNRAGRFSIKKSLFSFLGLSFLELSALTSFLSAFVILGGPDGRFLEKETLITGGVIIVISVLISFFALRLLSLPRAWAAIFIAPVVGVVVAQTSGVWVLTNAALTIGPVLCLIIVVAMWVWREIGIIRSG